MAATKKSTPKKAVKKSPAKKKSATKKAASKKAAPKKKAVKKKSTKSKKREDLMCFLTTACVAHYGLQEDGVELNKLRWFRDEYLLKSEEGASQVKTYYEIAPKIVAAIKKSNTSEKSYAYVYSVIQKAIQQIDKGLLEEASQSYTAMVKKLQHQFID